MIQKYFNRIITQAGNSDEKLFHLLMNRNTLKKIPISECTKYLQSVETFF